MCIFYDVTILSDWLIDKIYWIAIIAVMGDFPLIILMKNYFNFCSDVFLNDITGNCQSSDHVMLNIECSVK